MAAGLPVSARAAEPSVDGEWRLRADTRSAGRLGPLAAAEALQPGMVPPPSDSARVEAELRARAPLGPLSITANALAWAERARGGASSHQARVNELHGSADAGAWQASAGKKRVEWDVGFGFRPNDMVQQAERRSLDTATAEGRPLLQLEHFSAERAFSLVWAQPQRLNAALADSRDGHESALAARAYARAGAADLHGFARWGRHSRASLGAAVAWVASDNLALHASVRHLARHEAWQGPSEATGAASLQPRNPWQLGWRGKAGQWLLGGQWTGTQQQSLLIEAWHDGTAPSRADWRAWTARNQALWAAARSEAGAPGAAPAAAWAGNLAWQSTPWRGANLQRDNLFLRLAWQPEAWQLALDTLWHPADGGHLVTASLQWQGDAWRVHAGWRVYRGPADALLRQLPLRQQALLTLTRSF